jgi:hypothetical protein
MNVLVARRPAAVSDPEGDPEATDAIVGAGGDDGTGAVAPGW